MARYYDLDKLSKLIEFKADTLLEGKVAMLYVAKWLNLLPAANVQEVKHGYWEDICVKNGYGDIIEKQIECSVCEEFFKIESHDQQYWKNRFKICPFCGAKMDEEQKKE